ncbi:OpgC protein [mine drainage metagenome]|uniref:OpgC protein n=1 Tax=mine drainage metagenome TaxID=410659 RepID=A0A1J5Q2U4_9ZZZZ
MEAVTDHSRERGIVPAVHIDGDRRDLRLDACRGLALWFIFIDHIPGNAFAWLTVRDYGFSDTTEVFVFVSGYTCMLAYGGALREQGWPTIVARSLRRGVEIYAAFLLLLIGYFVLIWLTGGGSRYLDETNTRFFFENPGVSLMHAVVLQYTPVNTDILPTFVMLHLAFPVVLWLLIRNPAAALAASFLLYLMVQLFSWQVPAWPTGELYFNPLAWQIVFMSGMVLGTLTQQGAIDWGRFLAPERTTLPKLALMVLVFFLPIRIATAHGWVTWEQMTAFNAMSIRPSFGLVYLMSFASAVALVAWVVVAGPQAQSRAVQAIAAGVRALLALPYLRLIGRHSLQTYAWHVVLVYGVYYLDREYGPFGVGTKTVMAISCLMLLALPALWREHGRRMLGVRLTGV